MNRRQRVSPVQPIVDMLANEACIYHLRVINGVNKLSLITTDARLIQATMQAKYRRLLS